MKLSHGLFRFFRRCHEKIMPCAFDLDEATVGQRFGKLDAPGIRHDDVLVAVQDQRRHVKLCDGLFRVGVIRDGRSLRRHAIGDVFFLGKRFHIARNRVRRRRAAVTLFAAAPQKHPQQRHRQVVQHPHDRGHARLVSGQDACAAQKQGRHALRMADRKLQRDAAAHRDAEDVRVLDTGRIHDRQRVVDEIADRGLARRVASARAAVVEIDDAMLRRQSGEDRVPHCRTVEMTHDEHDGGSAALLLPIGSAHLCSGQ